MPWFKLDEGFHSHPKVLAAGNEAIGLYVRCGAYAAQHLTDGFIPEQVALLYGSAKLADTLVQAKLWRRAKNGWRMPDYLDYNPAKEVVDRERKAAAERQRRRRSKLSETIPVGKVHEPVDNPTENHRETSNSTPAHVPSRRDSRRESHDPDPIRTDPGSVVDVVTRTNGSKPSPELTGMIIKELEELTGIHVEDDWAAKIGVHILHGRSPRDPAAYVRQALRSDPDPRKRFLPLY